MRSKSTDQLRAILRGPEWTYYRNVLIELQRRGEDIKEDVVPILNLLISESRFHREGGWMILKEIYPDLAARVPDYNPKETDNVCKEKMQKRFCYERPNLRLYVALRAVNMRAVQTHSMKKLGQLLVVAFSLVHLQAQVPFTNALVALYPLDGNAYDFSGNGAHGTLSQVSFGNDRFGQGGRAAVFAGTSGSNVRIASTNWNLPPEFSVSVWFYFTANAGTESPRVLGTAGWEIGTETTGSARRIFLNTTTASAGGFTIYSSNSVPADAWIHVVAVKSSNQLTLNVNGALAGSVSVPQPSDYSRGLPEIGGNFGNGFDAFAGGIDDIRIYRRALSAVEVQQLYTFESTRPSISLTANLWPNASLETDSNSDGIPDFWNKGGSDVSLNFWDTNYFNSGSHSLAVWDTSSTQYGGWFSDNIGVAPGERYKLKFKRRYCSTGGSGMRVSARYSSSNNTFLSAIFFPVAGCQLTWEEVSSELIVPPGVSLLNLEIVSGGAVNEAGTNWIDDISLTRLWPNPALELDSNGDGAPDFWNEAAH
jgi:hypothetical protein